MSRIRSSTTALAAIGMMAGASAVAPAHAAPASQPVEPVEVTSTITLLTHDSFPTEGTTLNEALDAFTAQTGIAVEVVQAGDAGTMVSKAVLTAGNPEGDVLYGIDNTYLSRAVNGGVFEPYEAAGLDDVDEALTGLVPDHEATPIDFGDVCVNYDIDWFADEVLDPPTDLASLAEPEYADLLVVENPASSSPGLAFLMATVAEFGADGWVDYWNDLVANGVEIVDDWSGAYYERFSGTSDGPKPLVVSYGSSPPFEVLFADPPIDEPTTGVLGDTCFRQVEFAGVLAGTDAPDEARQLVDFLLTSAFQSTIALNLFVFPVIDVELPSEIVDFSVVPDTPFTLEPELIDSHREEWIETWTNEVLR